MLILLILAGIVGVAFMMLSGVLYLHEKRVGFVALGLFGAGLVFAIAPVVILIWLATTWSM